MPNNVALMSVARQPGDSAPAEEMATVRVLLADDSAVVRTLLRAALAPEANMLSAGCRIEICGVARDGVECLSAVQHLTPDLLVLDIEMPRMDGLTVLTELKTVAPQLPVIMFSTLTEFGAQVTLEALARGAADYVTKPSGQKDFASSIEELRRQLVPKIIELAKSRKNKQLIEINSSLARSKYSHLRLAELPAKVAPIKAVVIGVSTGGPTALEQLLARLPKNFPVPLLIVQHMPIVFTEILAKRLDGLCALKVREAVDGATVLPGDVWIAKGDWHMQLRGRADADEPVKLRLEQSEPMQYCRPAVDKLFFSAVEAYGAGALGVVMTGMGGDGAAGALALHRCGGVVLAQDEESSAIWGMPRRAIECGAVNRCANPEGLALELVRRTMRIGVDGQTGLAHAM